MLKIKEFQYKLLHGAIYTKEHLLRFGFVEDDQCSFCKQMTESYLHLFWDCVYVKPLWQGVIERFGLVELQNVKWENVHVGILGNSFRIKCCNSLIFTIKYIIYRSRSEGAVPKLDRLFKIILEYKDEEKELAIKRNKLGKHLQKWESVKLQPVARHLTSDSNHRD